MNNQVLSVSPPLPPVLSFVLLYSSRARRLGIRCCVLTADITLGLVCNDEVLSLLSSHSRLRRQKGGGIDLPLLA